MKVYFDSLIFDLQRMGGISVYFGELIARMLRSDFDVRVIEQRRDNSNLVRRQLQIPPDRIVREPELPLWIARQSPIRLKLREPSIVHASYYRTSYSRNAVNVVTVYDFAYEYFRRGLPKYVHSYRQGKAIANADGIICISHSTRRDLMERHPGLDPETVAVIHLSASEQYGPIAHAESQVPAALASVAGAQEGGFVLYVGERGHYKNFDLAVEAVSLLKDRRLLVVGGPALSVHEEELLARKMNGRYSHCGRVSATELNYLYNMAFCLLYPSSFEGFGIPILEAMQAGCPVVATNMSSIPEVAGDAGLLVDEVSADVFLERMRRLEDPAVRRAVITAGFEQAKQFSWDRTCEETRRFYRKVASMRGLTPGDAGARGLSMARQLRTL
jgi:mannosyltransferase